MSRRCLRIAGEESGELALRQQYSPREAVEIKSDNRFDARVDRPDATLVDRGQPRVAYSCRSSVAFCAPFRGSTRLTR